mgnify:CR=1 FL=1
MQMYDARMDALRARMKTAGIDVALITDDDNVYYLTGYYDYLHMEFGRPTILVVPREGDTLQFYAIEQVARAADDGPRPAWHYPARAPAYGPRPTGSRSSMISMARIFGAPDTVPAGKVARMTSIAFMPSFS